MTSRLLPPGAFGAYAVALSGVGLIGLVSGPSLGQAAARRDHGLPSRTVRLVGLSLVTGTIIGMLIYALAPLWGQLWGGCPRVGDDNTGAGVGDSLHCRRCRGSGHPPSQRSHQRDRVPDCPCPGRRHGSRARPGLHHARNLEPGDRSGIRLGDIHDCTHNGPCVGTGCPVDTRPKHRRRRHLRGEVRWPERLASVHEPAGCVVHVPVPWACASLGAFNRAQTLVTLPLESLQRAFNFTLFPELRESADLCSRTETPSQI